MGERALKADKDNDKRKRTSHALNPPSVFCDFCRANHPCAVSPPSVNEFESSETFDFFVFVCCVCCYLFLVMAGEGERRGDLKRHSKKKNFSIWRLALGKINGLKQKQPAASGPAVTSRNTVLSICNING